MVVLGAKISLGSGTSSGEETAHMWSPDRNKENKNCVLAL